MVEVPQNNTSESGELLKMDAVLYERVQGMLKRYGDDAADSGLRIAIAQRTLDPEADVDESRQAKIAELIKETARRKIGENMPPGADQEIPELGLTPIQMLEETRDNLVSAERSVMAAKIAGRISEPLLRKLPRFNSDTFHQGIHALLQKSWTNKTDFVEQMNKVICDSGMEITDIAGQWVAKVIVNAVNRYQKGTPAGSIKEIRKILREHEKKMSGETPRQSRMSRVREGLRKVTGWGRKTVGDGLEKGPAESAVILGQTASPKEEPGTSEGGESGGSPQAALDTSSFLRDDGDGQVNLNANDTPEVSEIPGADEFNTFLAGYYSGGGGFLQPDQKRALMLAAQKAFDTKGSVYENMVAAFDVFDAGVKKGTIAPAPDLRLGFGRALQVDLEKREPRASAEEKKVEEKPKARTFDIKEENEKLNTAIEGERNEAIKTFLNSLKDERGERVDLSNREKKEIGTLIEDVLQATDELKQQTMLRGFAKEKGYGKLVFDVQEFIYEERIRESVVRFAALEARMNELSRESEHASMPADSSDRKSRRRGRRTVAGIAGDVNIFPPGTPPREGRVEFPTGGPYVQPQMAPPLGGGRWQWVPEVPPAGIASVESRAPRAAPEMSPTQPGGLGESALVAGLNERIASLTQQLEASRSAPIADKMIKKLHPLVLTAFLGATVASSVTLGPALAAYVGANCTLGVILGSSFTGSITGALFQGAYNRMRPESREAMKRGWLYGGLIGGISGYFNQVIREGAGWTVKKGMELSGSLMEKMPSAGKCLSFICGSWNLDSLRSIVPTPGPASLSTCTQAVLNCAPPI